MSRSLSLRPLSSYDVKAVEWLDQPFLQQSAFHLLAGRKGSCKGTWICRVAAEVTTGALFPTPHRVIVVTSEDSIELDFKPRLIASGGNPELVEIVNGPFRLPEGIDWLYSAARVLGDVGLVIIDPIGNHTGGADTDKEGLVREAIKDLNRLADELGCVIVGVRHLGKDASRGALAAVLGSTAWVDVPRCVILMAADDEDDRVFHAQVVAGNRGPRNNQGRAYRLELADVPPARDITRLVPLGASTKDVELLLARQAVGQARPSSSAEARELILNLVEQQGVIDSDVLDNLVAAETGLAPKTIKNLRSGMNDEGSIAIAPEKDMYGKIVRWHVRRGNALNSQIPGLDAESPESASTSQIISTSLESVSRGPGEPDPEPAERGRG